MSNNISEIEEAMELFREVRKMPNVPDGMINDIILSILEKNINQHKDHIDRMARIEKAIAELQSGEMQKFHNKVFEENLEG